MNEANTEVLPAVQAIPNGDSFSVLVGGKIACQLSTGGAHRFASPLQAEVFGRHYARGFTGGTYLSADLDNFLT